MLWHGCFCATQPCSSHGQTAPSITAGTPLPKGQFSKPLSYSLYFVYPERYVIQDFALRVVYLVNLKFKDCFLINASADIHSVIHIYVYQLMGVFCGRLELCSTAAPDCRTGQNKGRYRKQELSFLLFPALRGFQ